MFKVLIWTVCSTHHQSHLHNALREAGVDLQVLYYGRIGADRIALGWDGYENLRGDEQYIDSSQDVSTALDTTPDWQERIHIIPGCADPFLRRLIKHISKAKTKWTHWSEPSRSGWRWWLSVLRKRRFARQINKYALGAFAIGRLAEEDFKKWGVDGDRIAFLPYSVYGGDRNATPDAECVKFCAGRNAFLYLGQLCHRKATDLLLEAFARVAQKNKDWVLLLVGADRSKGDYERRARELGVKDRVFFKGTIPFDRIDKVLVTAKSLLLPSRLDGWGVALNEGAAMGLALISTDRVGSAYHLIEPGENGFRVRANNAESLARAMSVYVRNPELAERHGKNSLKVFDELTPKRSAKRFIDIIESWLAMEKRD